MASASEAPARKPEVPARKTPQPNLQRKETLTKILCWTAGTVVEYVPEGKRAGTASYARYEKYSKAKTVGEALEFGSTPEDMVNDFMKGKLKVTGGPMREKPLTVEDVQRGDGMTETDKALGKFAKNFHREQLANELGMDDKSMGSKRSWCESPVMHGKRLKAEKAAEELMRDPDMKVTDEHVLSILRMWAFRRNNTRRNVAPADRPVVDSETFGLMRNQAGVWIVTHATRDYPAVTKLFLRWLQETFPVQDFSCTSIHVNSGFACRRHRDRDNLGPAVMRALGNFTGGGLWYWPEDNGVGALECLPEDARVSLDMCSAPAVIDGNRAHEVEPFEGERFGIVFHAVRNCSKIPPAVEEQLTSFGFRVPDKEAIEAATRMFAPPKGYGLEPVAPVVPTKRRAEKDARKRDRKRARKAAAAKGGESLLAKLCQGAKTEGGAKDAQKSKSKPKGSLKQAVLKLRSKDEPNRLGSLKLKNKVGISGGLLARMLTKKAAKGEEDGAGGSQGGAAAGNEEAGGGAGSEEAVKKPAAEGAKPAVAPLKPGKVMSGGLLARVIAQKKAKEVAGATEPSAPEADGASGEGASITPPRKRSASAGATRSSSTALASTKKQAKGGNESGKAGGEEAKAKGGSEAGRASGEEAKAGKAQPAAVVAPLAGHDAPAAAPAAAAPAATAAAAAVPPPPVAAVAVPPPAPVAAPTAALPPAPAGAVLVAPVAASVLSAEAAKAAATALGVSTATAGGAPGREAVQAQHFLPFATVLKMVEENPASTVSTLADYFQVLLFCSEQPEQLLQTALGLLLPEGPAPEQAIAAAVAAAFGQAAAQLVQEKGLAEAAQEGRRAKRSLRAPPPRLTLTEVSEALAACRSQGESESQTTLVRTLGATRAEGREAFFLVRLFQGGARPATGHVHAAVARALVRTGRGVAA